MNDLQRIILTIGDEKIGMYQLSPKEETLHITGLFLTESVRGKGIAKYLMNYFEQITKKSYPNGLELQVWENNPALKFYEHMGYEIKEKKGHKYIMTKLVS